jgi:ATP-dependent DNA helicase RecG
MDLNVDDTINLLRIIENGESETVEFKKSTSLLREGIETICAFANRKGGYLLFGLTDHGEVLGQQVSDDTLKNIANAVKLNTDPKIYPNIEKIVVKNRTCILVTVEESPLKPHLAYGRAFVRVGAVNQKMDRGNYEHMLQQRFNGYGFDHQIQSNAGMKDIDADLIYRFLETANSVRNVNESMFLPPELILQKLDLLKDEGLTKASLLLFGTDPDKFFSNHFEIKCGQFAGKEGYDEIVNEKEFHGNIIDNFYSTLGFVQDGIGKQVNKRDIHRSESWEFPISVIREALVNMVVHRDYRQAIKNTVEVRPQMVSFYNPAHLFEPTISIERLKKHHPSRPGNKLIARTFYMMGLFENWGSGTLKIISETVKSAKPSPEFFYEDGMFRLELYR